MKQGFSKIIIPFIIFVALLYVLAFTWFPTGYVGTTKKGGVNLGCICHGSGPTGGVNVTITGPDSVAVGTPAVYTVRITGGPAISGGFNVASQVGALDTILGQFTRKQDGELTHSDPKLFVAGTVVWTFMYTAPNTPMADTLFATGNSTNNDNSSDNDQWNWSANKNVRVYQPIGIINISSIAKDFSLSQNYPNPFNPETQINFTVGKRSHIDIKVYDMLGNLVTTVVNENLNKGEYKTDFNASGLASGTYFYTLFSNGEKISTKKMLLVK